MIPISRKPLNLTILFAAATTVTDKLCHILPGLGNLYKIL